MRLLADENVSPAVVRVLRQHGHDVLDTKEEDWFGFSDEMILKRARATRRVIISEDLDFGNLQRFPLVKHPGAILLRLPDMRPRSVAEHLLGFLAGAKTRDLRGAVVLLEEGRVQIIKS